MINKKLLVISISVIFCLSVLFCCIFVFSVKDVVVEYTVYSGEEVDEINEDFKEYKGKNLLFVSEEEVVSVLADNPYYEVKSVEKDFPNIIRVQVAERRAVYYVQDGSNVYKTNDSGVVLDVVSDENFLDKNSREMIYFTLTGINVENADKGSIIKTDNDELVFSIFEMAKAVNLTDCINHIEGVVDSSKTVKDALFVTYTGVEIWIQNANVNGKDKIIEAFNGYYNGADDYIKTCGYINVLQKDDGTILAIPSDAPKFKIENVDGKIIIVDLE